MGRSGRHERGKGASRFHRPAPHREYRKLYVIASEGDKTEPQYFAMFASRNASVCIRCLKQGRNSAPKHVLNRAKGFEAKEGLRSSDEMWLVVDRDDWQESELKKLLVWCREKRNRHLAVSNPCFEYWLLLHFDAGTTANACAQCRQRLRQLVPGYDKGSADMRKFRDKAPDAVRRAKRADTPRCRDWPRTRGTTVYRLVEKLLPQ